MAGDPLKFRCYQCNQLLGVSRSRVGKVVACPKCRADLIVPDPDEANLPFDGAGADSIRASDLNESDEEGISLELLDIRPEDIRVEPGVTWTPPPESAPRESFSPIPTEPEPPAAAAAAGNPPPIGLADLAGTTTVAPPSPPEPVVPPIRLEAPRIVEPRVAVARSRDVILPRSAVATWSLFVLLAQGLAFVAGLLAGHFLWRVH